MSLLSDVFEGNWDNVGNDITHAPSSFAAHPEEWAETGAAALAALTLGASIPETIGAEAALGAADLGAGAAETGLAADLGIADIGAGVGAADLGAAELGVAEAADLGLGADFGFGAGGLPSEALAFAPEASSLDTGGGFLDFAGAGPGPDFATDTFGAGATDLSGTTSGVTGTDAGFTSPTAGGGAGAAPGGAGATGTPAGFAPTDAELSGATTGTGPAATGGGGFNSLIQGAGGWGNILKYGAAVAPLALTLGMGQAQLPSSAQQLQGQAAALSQQGQADLAAARAGQLNAGQTAQIGQMRQDLTNQWRQTLYNQGVTDISKDARWPQIQADIDAKVTAATAQLLQQNITNALAETGQAASALTSIAQMQMASDTAFTNNLIRATAALGGAFGSSGTTIRIGNA